MQLAQAVQASNMEAPKALSSGFSIKDQATWPMDFTPTFARSYNLASVRSPEELAEEYLRGLQGGPAVKNLECLYPPTGRTSGPKVSWRRNVGGSRKKNTAFCKRKPAYDLIDEKGEDEAVKEMRKILLQCPFEHKESPSAINFVCEELKKRKDGYEERRCKAIARAGK
jgi:hypothetical protein